MNVDKKAVTLYLEPHVYEQLKRYADAERRSVSSTASLIIEADLFDSNDAPHPIVDGPRLRARPGPVQTVSNNHSLQTEGDLRRGGRQVDLEEAIAVTKRSGSRAAKHK